MDETPEETIKKMDESLKKMKHENWGKMKVKVSEMLKKFDEEIAKRMEKEIAKRMEMLDKQINTRMQKLNTEVNNIEANTIEADNIQGGVLIKKIDEDRVKRIQSKLDELDKLDEINTRMVDLIKLEERIEDLAKLMQPMLEKKDNVLKKEDVEKLVEDKVNFALSQASKRDPNQSGLSSRPLSRGNVGVKIFGDFDDPCGRELDKREKYSLTPKSFFDEELNLDRTGFRAKMKRARMTSQDSEKHCTTLSHGVQECGS